MPDGPDAAALFPLRAVGLTYAVRGRRLIDGIDLTLEQGPRTVVMGPNGAGKSLLLRLLHGLLTQSAGEVRWGGALPTEAVRRRQALVFQRPVLLRRTVGANLRFVLRLRRCPRTEQAQRLDRVLALAGLTDLVDRPARALSSGEQQRLALARALILEPEVLLLDEPTASLDPAAVGEIEALIEAAQGRATKIVLVTHDVGQARRLADEVIFLHRGRLVEHTPAAEFFTQPRSVQAQAYLDGRLVL